MKEIVSCIHVEEEGEEITFLNYSDEDSNIHHVRIPRKDVDLSNLPIGTVIKRDLIYPIYEKHMKLLDYKVCKGLMYFKHVDLSNVGYFSGYKRVFVDEINTYEKLSKLNIPNVCKYHGVIVDKDEIKCIVLEGYGVTLRSAMDKRLGLDYIVILDKIEFAVHEMHKYGIVHGDINPRNIMLDDKLEPYLIDFDSSGASMDKQGSTGYMTSDYSKTPEQDIYSLNIVRTECAKLLP
ncbi:hypothetical protein GGH92_000185 [Coemansia sp. RSA 2673]|nr:hypothetical protein GGH92_000185 [Coemansia sp. RSA 2673]